MLTGITIKKRQCKRRKRPKASNMPACQTVRSPFEAVFQKTNTRLFQFTSEATSEAYRLLCHQSKFKTKEKATLVGHLRQTSLVLWVAAHQGQQLRGGGSASSAHPPCAKCSPNLNIKTLFLQGKKRSVVIMSDGQPRPTNPLQDRKNRLLCICKLMQYNGD